MTHAVFQFTGYRASEALLASLPVFHAWSVEEPLTLAFQNRTVPYGFDYTGFQQRLGTSPFPIDALLDLCDGLATPSRRGVIVSGKP